MLLVLGLSLPAGFLLTIATWRFWGWFEAKTGIESLGHSGPAEWCFWVIYGFCVVVGGLLLARWRKGNDAGPKAKS